MCRFGKPFRVLQAVDDVEDVTQEAGQVMHDNMSAIHDGE